MTTHERIESLYTAAGAAGDSEQVALCERAMAGDPIATAECLRVCRESEIEAIDVRAWCGQVSAGDYLARYWDGEHDPKSLCGWSEVAIDGIRRRLRARDLTLAATDLGLRVVARESEVQP